MCVSKAPSRVLKLTAIKRHHSSLHIGLQSDVLKAARQVQNKQRRKGVQFSSNVSLRCHFNNRPSEPSTPQESTWMDKLEIFKIQKKAKTLAFLHRGVRSKIAKAIRASNHGSHAQLREPTLGETIRYEMAGESLRGMEHFTHPTFGKTRRSARCSAMKAVADEQTGQLIERVLENTIAAGQPTSCDNAASGMDHSKVAQAYGAHTKSALAYAAQIAEEDAKVAAAILAEDLATPEAPVITKDAAPARVVSPVAPFVPRPRILVPKQA